MIVVLFSTIYDEYWIQVCSTIREGRFVRESGYQEQFADFFRAPAAIS